MVQWSFVTEIVVVWNSSPQTLSSTSSSSSSSSFFTKEEGEDADYLRRSHDDPSHKVRLFYSHEYGLGNDLLNRYSPLIAPVNEAVLYFDDDGPFFDERAMAAGFALWRRDSRRQVACFGRNLRFVTPRMVQAHRVVPREAYQWQLVQSQSQSPNSSSSSSSSSTLSPPRFTTKCATEPIAYNFHVFPQFQAHMALPSGSFLHRHFLCWIWHPAFAELRQYVHDHPTHPGKLPTFFFVIITYILYSIYYDTIYDTTLFLSLSLCRRHDGKHDCQSIVWFGPTHVFTKDSIITTTPMGRGGLRVVVVTTKRTITIIVATTTPTLVGKKGLG